MLISQLSTDLVDYIFDKRYTNTRKTYCGLTATAGNFGATQMQSGTTVTLCPSSFSSNAFVNTLGNGDTAPTAGASIKTVLPKSATLFHELFHVTQGNAETPDASCKYKFIPPKSRKNADTITNQTT
jgi:hypothetical protein